MAKQRFDWRLAVVLIVAGTVFVTAVVIVHNWQRNTWAGQKATAVTPVSR